MNWKHLILPGVAGTVGLLAAVSIARTQPYRRPTEPVGLPPANQYAHAVAATGLVEPASESITIGSPVAGIVAGIPVRVGDPVEAGAPLIELEVRHLRAEREVRERQTHAAEARAATARTVLAEAEDHLRRAEALRRDTVISEDEVLRRRFAADQARSRLAEAGTEIQTARAQAAAIEVELDRHVIRAPQAGRVLRLDLRVGEAVAAGPTRVVIGQVDPLHVRVDVDEHEAWRVQPGAAATGHVRGQPQLTAKLSFLRFEPVVIPKRSLTGDPTERVDTRVLQALYRIESAATPVRVGQQMDVFIEAPAETDRRPGPGGKG